MALPKYRADIFDDKIVILVLEIGRIGTSTKNNAKKHLNYIVPKSSMFVRIKKISGKEYAYLVENTWRRGRSWQKVKKYLGPVIQYKESQGPFDKDEEYFKTTSVKKIFRDIARHTAGNAPVVVDVKKGTITKNEKHIVLALENGYLYTESLRKLLNFKPAYEEQRGKKLAETLLQAGIQADQQLFISLYRKIYNV